MPLETETEKGRTFEDFIDGYFPLRISLMQMLDRLGAPLAHVEIEHAPIMRIPDLPHDAPVPLNICAGRAGMIDRLNLRVERNGAVSGAGTWHWLDGSAAEDALDPMTRLAEPAYLRGFLPASTDRVTRSEAPSEHAASGVIRYEGSEDGDSARATSGEAEP